MIANVARRAPQYRGLRLGTATSDRVRLAAGLDNVHTFTVAAWIYPTTLTSGKFIWGKGPVYPTSGFKCLMLGTAATGSLRIGCGGGLGDMDWDTTAAVLTTNRWQFVCGTCVSNGATIVGHMYVGDPNGMFLTEPARGPGVGAGDGSGAASADNTLTHTIGNSAAASPTAAFQGAIGMFAHWNRALSLAELYRVMQGVIPGNGLDIWFNTGERGAGRRVINYAGNSAAPLHGTITGCKSTNLIQPEPVLPFLARARGKSGATVYTMPAAVGSFAVNGQAAALRAAHSLVAGQGSYAVNGQSSTLRRVITLAAGQGSYALGGQAAALRANRAVVASVGAFALNGQAAVLRVQHVLTAVQGAYTLAGQDVTLTKAGIRSMAADVGLYSLTGQDAGLTPPASGGRRYDLLSIPIGVQLS